MFPTPIQNYSLKINIGYRVLLVFTLLIWLLPLIAVMLTSIRTFDDVLAGNYWTFPEETALVSNYLAVFEDGKMAGFSKQPNNYNSNSNRHIIFELSCRLFSCYASV